VPQAAAHGAAAAALAHRDAHPWCDTRIDFGPVLEQMRHAYACARPKATAR